MTCEVKIFDRDVRKRKVIFMTSRRGAVTSEVRGRKSCYFYLFEFRITAEFSV